jgi:hypothetical protein
MGSSPAEMALFPTGSNSLISLRHCFAGGRVIPASFTRRWQIESLVTSRRIWMRGRVLVVHTRE